MRKVFLYSTPIAVGFATFAAWALMEPSQKASELLQQETNTVNSNQAGIPIGQMQAQLSGLQASYIELQNLALENKGHTSTPAVDLNSLDNRNQANASSPKNNENKQELSQEELRQQRQKSFSRIENSFLSEERDPSWSITTEQTLKTLVAGKSFSGANLIQSECRATACQLDIAYSDRDAMDNFSRTFPNMLGWEDSSGESQVVYESNGEIRVRIFISKAGHKIPGSDS